MPCIGVCHKDSAFTAKKKCCLIVDIQLRCNLCSTDSLIAGKEEEHTQHEFVERQFVVLENRPGKQVLLVTAFPALCDSVPCQFSVMGAAAFFANISIGIFCLKEEVITGFFIVGVLLSEVDQ